MTFQSRSRTSSPNSYFTTWSNSIPRPRKAERYSPLSTFSTAWRTRHSSRRSRASWDCGLAIVGEGAGTINAEQKVGGRLDAAGDLRGGQAVAGTGVRSTIWLMIRSVVISSASAS